MILISDWEILQRCLELSLGANDRAPKSDSDKLKSLTQLVLMQINAKLCPDMGLLNVT